MRGDLVVSEIETDVVDESLDRAPKLEAGS